MPCVEWTKDSIRSFALDKMVSARDALGDYAPLPAWLDDPRIEELEFELVEFIELVHPHDRQSVVEMYGRSLSCPNEALSEEIRFGPTGEQVCMDLTLINLFDNSDVGALLAIAEPTGQVADGDYSIGPGGGHKPTGWMLLDVDLSGVIRRVEGDSLSMLGYSNDEMIGHLPAEFYPPEDVLSSIRIRRTLISDPNATITTRRQWRRRDGSMVWVENSYARRHNPLPGQSDVLLVLWDITDKIEDEEALRRSEANLRLMAENFRALADEVPAAVFQCSASGEVSFHNARWQRIIEDNDRVATVHDLAAPSDRQALRDLFAEMGGGSRRESSSIEFAGHDGDTQWRLTLRTVVDSPSGQAGFIGSLEDVTSTVMLRNRASRDPLTMIMNRSSLLRSLSEAMASQGTEVVVAFLDLDRFKTVNDTWGHDAGDAVLKEVARRLQATIRPSDSVARWGGDEFVVVLRGEGASPHEQLIERIRSTLDVPVEFTGGRWKPGASIGVAKPERGESVESVITRADQAMFEEKRTRSSRGSIRH